LNIHTIRKLSKDCGVPYRQIINHRCYYLADEAIRQIYSGDPVWVEIGWEKLDEVIRLRESLKPRPMVADGDKVTDEMVERARDYPVDKLINFSHGKATAFCHDDRNPTMYHAFRSNRANCPACNLSFDAIKVLMVRDGYTFAEAVRRLGG